MEELLSEEELTGKTSGDEIIEVIYTDRQGVIKMVNKEGFIAVLLHIRVCKGVSGETGRWLFQKGQKETFLCMLCSSVKLLLATGCCTCL